MGACGTKNLEEHSIPVALNIEDVEAMFDHIQEYLEGDHIEYQTDCDIILTRSSYVCKTVKDLQKLQKQQKLKITPEIQIKFNDTTEMLSGTWMGRYKANGRDIYLEMTFNKNGTGTRLVNMSTSTTSKGVFLVEMENVSGQTQTTFRWEDRGTDFHFQLKSTDIFVNKRFITGHCFINGVYSSKFELLRVLQSKNSINQDRTIRTLNHNDDPLSSLSTADKITEYSMLADKNLSEREHEVKRRISMIPLRPNTSSVHPSNNSRLPQAIHPLLLNKTREGIRRASFETKKTPLTETEEYKKSEEYNPYEFASNEYALQKQNNEREGQRSSTLTPKVRSYSSNTKNLIIKRPDKKTKKIIKTKKVPLNKTQHFNSVPHLGIRTKKQRLTIQDKKIYDIHE